MSMYKTTRICRCCGKPFTPEFGRQLFCSPACRKKDTTKRKRIKTQSEKGGLEARDTRKILESKTYLSITEAALYLGVSRPTIYKRIRNGELKALRVTPRTIRIPIAKLETDTTIKPRFKVTADPSTLISKDEVLTRYAVSESLLYRKLKKENTRPRLVNGKSYLPKDTLDKILKPKPRYNPEEWYDAAEIMQSEGITRKHLSEILRKKQISCIRIGHTLLIDKKEWNTGRLLKGDIGKNYLTVDQAKKHYRIGQQTFYDKTNAAGIQGTRTGKFVYYKKSDLDRLFKDKSPKIPTEIRRNYILGRDALKHYHIGQKRFSEETQAARVTKVRTEGNFVWYKKDELDRIFNKLDIK